MILIEGCTVIDGVNGTVAGIEIAEIGCRILEETEKVAVAVAAIAAVVCVTVVVTDVVAAAAAVPVASVGATVANGIAAVKAANLEDCFPPRQTR